MTAFILAIAFTISVSALCSVLEAMLLSTTTSDIQSLKEKKPKLGALLEHFREDLEETTSAILGLNTIANTLGATLVGGLAAQLFGENKLIYFSIGMTVGILIFSEVIPKNIGVIYRSGIQPILIRPLQLIRMLMRPVSYLCKLAVILVVPKRAVEDISDDDIRLMAEKSEKDGNLTQDEKIIITNALSLDEIAIDTIMTPRTVVFALEQGQCISDVFQNSPNLPFARIPVYNNSIDTIVGVARRRDLLTAKANDEDTKTISELMSDPLFILGNRTAGDALRLFLKNNQQLAIVLDEYGSVDGVVAMEDVVEHILGKEIFEDDDVAIDMREFAKQQAMQRIPN
jgi:CBS domain containing-hemolysin-like protein